MSANEGKIKQVLGAVVDVNFENKLPQILDALVVKHDNKDLVLEESSTESIQTDQSDITSQNTNIFFVQLLGLRRLNF